MDEDTKWNLLLQQRTAPPETADFAERIIWAARRMEQVKPVTMLCWVNRLFAECRIRHPGMVMLGMLCIGILVGIETGEKGAYSVSSLDIAGELLDEEEIL